jgi:hypothetical protein
MRSCVIQIAVTCLATEAGCSKPSTQPPPADVLRVQRYTASHVSQNAVCDNHPMVPEEDRPGMTPTGAYDDVRWCQSKPEPPRFRRDKGQSSGHQASQDPS